MSPEHFEIKNKDLPPFNITIKNRQLSTVPLNFDCSRVWQWTVNSTTVAFGSESVQWKEKIPCSGSILSPQIGFVW